MLQTKSEESGQGFIISVYKKKLKHKISHKYYA